MQDGPSPLHAAHKDRIAINGMGRIGRTLLRLVARRGALERGQQAFAGIQRDGRGVRLARGVEERLRDVGLAIEAKQAAPVAQARPVAR